MYIVKIIILIIGIIMMIHIMSVNLLYLLRSRQSA